MTSQSLGPLPEDLVAILRKSFFIRFSVRGRRTGQLRTVETTYVWDGGSHLYISGYPGKRDWVANLYANPQVIVHTVEGGKGYDIPATARVIHTRQERTPHLLAFLSHWASRPEAPRMLFLLLLKAVRLNRALSLPWWGPFYVVRKVFDRMPCVEITFTEYPRENQGGPSPLTSLRR
jgi:deazaflavin-dependent oxidoreductase (nitroreductase family)